MTLKEGATPTFAYESHWGPDGKIELRHAEEEEADGEGVVEGLAVALAVFDGLPDTLGVVERVTEGDHEPLAVTEAEAVTDGVPVGETGDGDTDGVAVDETCDCVTEGEVELETTVTVTEGDEEDDGVTVDVGDGVCAAAYAAKAKASLITEHGAIPSFLVSETALARQISKRAVKADSRIQARLL